jgi:hypothetical protein
MPIKLNFYSRGVGHLDHVGLTPHRVWHSDWGRTFNFVCFKFGEKLGLPLLTSEIERYHVNKKIIRKLNEIRNNSP